MKIVLLFLMTVMAACSTHSADRGPGSVLGYEVVSTEQLQGMSAAEIIEILKKNCCQPLMVEPSTVSSWGPSDVAELTKMLGDQTPVSPVVSSISSVACRDKKSTIDREARHLIQAIKKGRYPAALCSTYDLVLE